MKASTPAYILDTSVIVDLYAGGLLDELFRLPFLLTSDRHLAEAAQEQGVTVHGTLWILDEMVRVGLIAPAAAGGLQRMLASGSRLPRPEYQRRLERWG